MIIVGSTDNKYLGTELQLPVKGDTVLLNDFACLIEFVRPLENGNTNVGNINYQLEIKE